MKQTIIKILLLIIWLDNAFAQDNAGKIGGQEVAIRRTEIHTINSKFNDAVYPIYVALPASYSKSDQSYPVIIQLDAYSSFGILVQMQRLLLFNNEAPEAIIVGVSSEGGSKEFNYNRARDFTPTFISQDSLPITMRTMLPVSGGADKFFSFIKNELIPLIENKYRIKKDDLTLAGHSLGGLFCFYSFFKEPALFKRYIIVSPALSWDKEFVFSLLEGFVNEHKEIDAVIYTAVGGLESKLFTEPWKKMVSKLKEKSISKLRIIDELIPNETHYTMIPFIASHGLKSVFGK